MKESLDQYRMSIGMINSKVCSCKGIPIGVTLLVLSATGCFTFYFCFWLTQMKQPASTIFDTRNDVVQLRTKDTLCVHYNNTYDNNYHNEKRLSRVAVCIRGDERGIDNAYNIYKTIIEPFDYADVFAIIHLETSNTTPLLVQKLESFRSKILLSGRKQWSERTKSRIFRIVAVDTKMYTIDELSNEMKQAGMNFSYWMNQNTNNRKTNRSNNALGPFFDKGSGFFQYRDLHRCNELIEHSEQHKRNNQQYEFVIIVRTDSWCLGEPFCAKRILKRPQTRNLAPVVYIPSGEDYDGINDRLILLPRLYSTQFLTGPYGSLIKNTNPNWFRYNTETVIHNNLYSILNSSTINTSEGTIIVPPKQLIVRVPPLCFITCNYNKHKGVDQRSVGNYSWKSVCRDPLHYHTTQRLPYMGPLRYAHGYKGYKYLFEFRAALHQRRKIYRSCYTTK